MNCETTILAAFITPSSRNRNNSSETCSASKSLQVYRATTRREQVQLRFRIRYGLQNPNETAIQPASMPMREGGCALVDAEDEAFEVAGFGEGEDFGVVGGGGVDFEELDAAAGVDGGGGDDLCELL